MIPVMVAGEAVQQSFIENIPWTGPGFVDSAKREPDPALPHVAPPSRLKKQKQDYREAMDRCLCTCKY